MNKDFIEKNIDDVEDFLWSIISKYDLDRYPSIDREDLFQEAWVALKEADSTNDSPQLADFDTYAYNVVDNKIKDLLDKNARFSNREYNSSPFTNDKSPIPLVERIPDEKGLSVEKQARLEVALDTLDSTEREILRLHSEGYTQQEIANNPDIGYTQPHVGRVLEGAIEQVKGKF